MQSHHIHLSGQPFHYLTWGEPTRPPLLMLHGFPEYSAAWEELASRLSEHFFCIAPDQRGYGQSWAPAEVGQYTTSKLVSDMAELIAALDLAPTAVIGHDWGAAVAYGLAMMLPDLTSHLIIVNGVHPAPFQRAIASGGAQTAASQYIHALREAGSEERLAANQCEKLLALFSAKMNLTWLTPAKRAAYVREWTRPGRLRGMINWYRASPLRVARPGAPLTDLPALPRARLMVHQPHLLIWGQDDTALLPEATAGLEDYAPNLTRVKTPGADHWICHQKPDAVAAAIRDWLQD
ncbi:alpha/beta fold hydrolase [Aquicoccus sp. G2-2]|uniref:alpha/beta fold hydrolase n=1 Tax=Aquicoccus sp. G2-2 TaxID=3092120 RepID=UPI002ADFE6D7|nr:alpha/beta hydrolase [Aquicoccus sp. G2-2]MEA1112652.1 alpha/beta hydrolase [Aquicoccus sp. G2-2]